jgi:hypothetical protein
MVSFIKGPILSLWPACHETAPFAIEEAAFSALGA